MGIMSFLRNRAGIIIVAVIGLSLVAFLVGDVVRYGGSFFKDDRNMLGEAGGEKIAYDTFNTQVQQQTAQYQQRSGQSTLNPQTIGFIQESVWNQMVAQQILTKEIDRVGLALGVDETHSMEQGENPNAQIVQAFGDPKTGQLDRAKLNNFLTNLQSKPDSDQMKVQWHAFIDQIRNQKLSEKYVSLVTNGLYVNSLEAKDDYDAKNKLANFKYVTFDYASVPNSKITVTDDDYKSYYDDHKSEFNNQRELRTFNYVSINASPSKADTGDVLKKADKLAADFKTAANDSLFVQINAETKAPLVYLHKGTMEPKVDSMMFNAPNGFVYGPYLSNGSYKIAKLVDSRMEPDSVKARHILIDAKTIGPEKAQAQADSLKKLIQGGKSFAELANTFSIDKASAVQGGDLGTFGRGKMVPAFEDAVFNAKKGDLKIVTTQFGVHLIEIEDQKGSSKVAKIAVVDVPLRASSATQTAEYSKAQRFLGSLTKDNFDQVAKRSGLKINTATDINGTAAVIPGIENAREIVKWAFNAEKGDFSDKVYVAGDQYIIARLTQIKPKGTLPLDMVKSQIAQAVKNKLKGKYLDDKFSSALNGSTTIDSGSTKSRR